MTSLKNCMLVPDTGWLQSSNVSYHTGTSFLSFTCSVCNSKASMQCAYKESTQIALIFAFFRSLMRGGWGRRNSVAPQAGSAALGIHGVDLHTKKWSYELVLELRETIHITSINPDVVRSAAKLRERKKSPFHLHLLRSVTNNNSSSRGVPSPVFAGPDGACHAPSN
jgi:hypothetical protein